MGCTYSKKALCSKSAQNVEEPKKIGNKKTGTKNVQEKSQDSASKTKQSRSSSTRKKDQYTGISNRGTQRGKGMPLTR